MARAAASLALAGPARGRADDIGPKSGNSSSGFPEEAAAVKAEAAETDVTAGEAGMMGRRIQSPILPTFVLSTVH